LFHESISFQLNSALKTVNPKRLFDEGLNGPHRFPFLFACGCNNHWGKRFLNMDDLKILHLGADVCF